MNLWAVALAAVQRRPLAVSIGPASKVLNSQQSGGKSLSKCSTIKVSWWLDRGGEKHLRALEMRFLDAGITVARTADDLVRYHDKLLIFDRKTLFMLSFNFTHLDIDHSRGFGIITSNAKIVQEAIKLFEADCTRTSYSAGLDTLVVSPVNSRKVLTTFDLRRPN